MNCLLHPVSLRLSSALQRLLLASVRLSHGVHMVAMTRKPGCSMRTVYVKRPVSTAMT
ncbi:hypothetical protein [Microbulbifer halophilus]|uniref:Uncharacterized protein n=1 Tax=Microbulbifer halophilus TaxID=453963 RepID=A0ABW5EJL8_9GAMM|nr:hypothetical protein [Microbulbifer halophilus]MCW8128658.1 hypothetical protein [Microbulbifer halophilus]